MSMEILEGEPGAGAVENLLGFDAENWPAAVSGHSSSHSQPGQPHTLTQGEYDAKNGANYEEYGLHLRKIFDNRIAQYRNHTTGKFSPKKFAVHTLLELFPIVNMLRKYKIKKDAANDIMAGLTIFVMAIPQGLSYGLLSGIGAVNGLYTSCFPVFLYFFLGSSRHLAIGVAAAVCLLTNSITSSVLLNPPAGVTVIPAPASSASSASTIPTTTHASTASTSSGGQPSSTGTVSSDATSANIPTTTASSQNNLYIMDGVTYTQQEFLVQINVALVFFVAVVQLIMAFLHLGIVTIIFSNAMISAYTAGIAITVATSQIPYILGYKIGKYSGPLQLVYTYIDLGRNIVKFNWISFVIGIISIAMLYTTKEIIQPRLDKIKWYPKLPLPMDLLLIIIGTVVSYLVNLSSYGVFIVGTIPSGIPTPIVPNLEFWPSIIGNGLLLAIMSYSLSLSLGSIYAQKGGYFIDSTQEMLAYGIGNLLGSFMHTITISGSVGKSAVNFNAGAKTQIASLIQAVGLIFVLLFIAPLFQYVPNCILGAIIIVAVKNMILQVTELPGLWRTSFTDFAVWILTYVGTLLLDVDSGLLCGVAVSALAAILRSILAHCALLGRMPDSELYLEKAVYNVALEEPGIKVFRFDGALYFASFSYFKYKLIEKTGQNPISLKKRQKKDAKRKALEDGKKLKFKEKVTLAEPPSISASSLSITASSDPHLRKTSKAEKYETLKSVQEGTCVYVNQLHGNSTTTLTNALELPSFASMATMNGDIDKNTTVTVQVPTSDGTAMANEKVHHIVLDCSAWGYLDDTAIKLLLSVFKEYKEVKIRVLLAECNAHVRMMLARSEFAKKCKDPECFYVRVHDAVLAAREYHQRELAKRGEEEKPEDANSQDVKPNPDGKLGQQTGAGETNIGATNLDDQNGLGGEIIENGLAMKDTPADSAVELGVAIGGSHFPGPLMSEGNQVGQEGEDGNLQMSNGLDESGSMQNNNEFVQYSKNFNEDKSSRL